MSKQLIENDEISSFIDVIVNDISEALSKSKSDSTFILTQVGWDHIKIGDLFFKYNSIDQVFINLGLSHQIQNQYYNEPNLCSICMTNQINISLSCNHQFCNDCLNMHIEEQLKNTGFLKCLYFQCNKIILTIFYSHLVRDIFRLCYNRNQQLYDIIFSNLQSNLIYYYLKIIFTIKLNYFLNIINMLINFWMNIQINSIRKKSNSTDLK
ncbi:unnamed protein product [Paramecium sonneborni]|uniref:RING-type domain-containing protein n=1 Tax=Paramecium sonneborni TaxID=65129 RepID=A0A8S1LAW4_9CILI|nr:unnamed protein product [Paramecium sonneborni]